MGFAAIIRGFPRFPFATLAIILTNVLFVKFFENDFLCNFNKPPNYNSQLLGKNQAEASDKLSKTVKCFVRNRKSYKWLQKCKKRLHFSFLQKYRHQFSRFLPHETDACTAIIDHFALSMHIFRCYSSLETLYAVFQQKITVTIL